ncbi:hypothetical protein Cagg_1062 [Chloroflexus aggregans DSM 9485]|uniref:Uncharacterized protein n=1 Tax=Chloroflexus aggregans (strain MD-66 / DSM 9485) TaxID=326427 RepID=B8G719_CHLAD|nr:hypothetical protein Cagg_1062 [Chloroflexus aggregans DSM 9485]
MGGFTLTPDPSPIGAGEGSVELRFEALHSDQPLCATNLLPTPQPANTGDACSGMPSAEAGDGGGRATPCYAGAAAPSQ